MSIRKILLLGATSVAILAIGLLVVLGAEPAFAVIEPATDPPPSPTPAIIAPNCPVSTDQLGTSGGLSVCVDRGEGSTYRVGDQITVCASTNIPRPAIYPPPPPPTIRVEDFLGDTGRTILEAQFARGNRCVTGTISPPTGQETVRVQAIRADGTPFLESTATFTTRPR